MADSPLGERQIPDPPTDEPRLESWGEIAAYLRREIRTVQRWERYQGLPVRRLQIGKLGDGEVAAHVTASTETDEQKSQGQADGNELPGSRPRITRLHITITLLTLLVLAAVTPGVYLLRRGHSPVRSA